MPHNDEYLDLITRYLNDPTNALLKAEVTTFRSASQDNESYFLEIEKIWKHAPATANLEKIQVADSTKRFAKILYQKMPKKSFAHSWFSGVAASLLLVAFGYWLYTKIDSPNYLVKITSNQTDSVKLADGSVVILAENSEFRYPKEFKLPTREVTLTKGQAFFRIAKDKEHPFKVSINQSFVSVLGTSFNIKLTDSSIVLGVKTGRVLF